MAAPRADWFFIAFAALVSSCSGETGPEGLQRALASVMATCSSASGEVQVRRAGEGFWSGVTVGTLLQPGDWVRTAPASHTRLEVRSGGAIDLEDDALVVIEPIAPTPVAEAGPVDQPLDGATAEALVEVKSGVVRGILGPQLAHRPVPALHVKTADGSRLRVARRGPGEVEVRLTRSAERTELSVSKGEAAVTLKADRPEQVFAAGSAAQLEGDTLVPIEPLAAPTPSQPPPDARLLFSAPAKLAWSRVASAQGYRLQLANDASFTTGAETIEVPSESYLLASKAAGVKFFRAAAKDAAGRVWDYGPSRRVFLEGEAPKDLLLTPADKAIFGHPGTPPRILFSWDKLEGVHAYRLMVWAGEQSDPRVSEVTTATQLVVESLSVGTWRWGVVAVDDGRPLFLTPRRLMVVKGAALRAPRIITRWGDK